MDTDTQQQQQPMEGVSNPPNGGQVLDIANPEANDATVSQTAASSTPPPPTPAPAPSAAPQVAPQGANGAPVQDNSTNGPDSKTPDLSKAKGLPINSATQLPQGPPPAVQKASMFHEVAQALAGGPRYTYSVDEYGNMQKKQVPISNGHLALAIAMEALTGAAAGFGVPNGPGNLGRAASAGFNAGAQQQQKITQQAKDEATQDFARRAQTTEMNMRLALNARQIGKMDEEDTDKYIAQYKDIADLLQSQYQGYVQAAGVSYKDLAKYNVTADTAIPYKKVPRLDSNGKQVELNGKPQWDIDYMILKPDFKAKGLITPDAQSTLAKWGVKGMDNPNIQDAAMNARLGLANMSLATHLSTAQTAYDNIFGKVDEANDAGQSSSQANVIKPGTLKGPAIKNPQVQGMADNAAAKVAPSVSSVVTPDNFQALIRGIINQESGGNAKAVSPTGATGVMQLTGSTAEAMGVTDRTDPQQNIEGGTKYFAQLLNQFKDPNKALAAYYSGPGAIGPNGQIQDTKSHTAADTQQYVNDVSQRIGLVSTGNAEVATKKDHPSPTEWAKDHPTFAKDTEAFMAAYDASGNNVDAALKHLQSTGQGNVAANVSSYLKQYGDDTITTHDNYLATQAEDRKLAEQNRFAKQKADEKAANDTAVQQKKEDMINTLLTAKIPDGVLQMSDKDAVNALHTAGVTLPADALIDAKQIANYGAGLNIASNKRWFKDAKMDQGELLSIVKMFNPTFDTKNYDALRAEKMPNSPQRKTIDSAAQLANHLNTMEDIINSQDAQKSTIPALNKLLQNVGYQTGGTQLTDVQTIANIVTSELGKTLAGGFAPDKEQIQNIIKTMNPANATEQMKSILGLYVKAMHGKVAPLDEEYNTMSGASDQHLPMPKSLTSILQKYGEDTPWEKNKLSQPQTAGGLTPNDASQYPKVSKDGKIGMTADGKKYTIATGQLITP